MDMKPQKPGEVVSVRLRQEGEAGNGRRPGQATIEFCDKVGEVECSGRRISLEVRCYVGLAEMEKKSGLWLEEMRVLYHGEVTRIGFEELLLPILSWSQINEC